MIFTHPLQIEELVFIYRQWARLYDCRKFSPDIRKIAPRHQTKPPQLAARDFGQLNSYNGQG